MEVLQWALIIISIPVLIVMILQTRKRAKALSERIEEYREEQEASQSGPINPYESLSDVFGGDAGKTPPESPPENGPRPQ